MNCPYGVNKPAMSYGGKKPTMTDGGSAASVSSHTKSSGGDIMTEVRHSDFSRLQGDFRSMRGCHLEKELSEEDKAGDPVVGSTLSVPGVSGDKWYGFGSCQSVTHKSCSFLHLLSREDLQ